MHHFKDNSIEKYCSLLSSTNPTPGGGTTAALEAALGASFIAMVASISFEKYSGYNHKAIAEGAEKLKQTFLKIMDDDTKAYDALYAVKDSGEDSDKTAAIAAKQNALKTCIECPLLLLEKTVLALTAANELSFDFYRPTASDLGLAALSLETAARGAYLTIKINLKRITDKQYLKKNKAESKRLLKLAEKLSSKIYKKMLRTTA